MLWSIAEGLDLTVNVLIKAILGIKPTPKPKPKPTQKKNMVHLPKSAKTWRTYRLNVQPVKVNSDWTLTPSAFGGLTYEKLGIPYANFVTINTSCGKRNIFVGPQGLARRLNNTKGDHLNVGRLFGFVYKGLRSSHVEY